MTKKDNVYIREFISYFFFFFFFCGRDFISYLLNYLFHILTKQQQQEQPQQ